MSNKKRRKSRGISDPASLVVDKNVNVNQKIIQLMELINSEGITCNGYHSLDQDPTIATACKKFAGLVGLISWHLMNDTEDGDFRIKNELSRKIDINPNSMPVNAGSDSSPFPASTASLTAAIAS